MKNLPVSVKIKNLNINYIEGVKQKFCALKNINLNIYKNKITVIMGPSGCGKTTFLKSLNRLHQINENSRVSGSVFIEKQDIYHSRVPLPQLRKRVGLVGQKPTPLPMSIFKNLTYGPLLHQRLRRDQLFNLAKDVLTRVSLWEEVKDRLNSSAADLSLGQQQRLSIARALSVEPEILLCDEITSALDPVSSGRIEELLRDLSGEYTIICVSHTLRQVQRLADFVVFMYQGELIEYDHADVILSSPRSKLTQSYIAGEFS